MVRIFKYIDVLCILPFVYLVQRSYNEHCVFIEFPHEINAIVSKCHAGF